MVVVVLHQLSAGDAVNLASQAQKEICSALEAEEEPRYGFRVDRWEREEGGGGVTCVIQVGTVGRT